MGMSIRREDRQGKAIEEIPDMESLLSRFFPSWDDESYHFLRYIDPWGETVFNHL
jgi:Phosphoglucomutase/phosphomannomutase, alpha/beta/alpha domain I